jgi:hypothetical protein
VGVGDKGRGDGVEVGGRGVDVGGGMKMVGGIVGMKEGVGAGAQEARCNISKKATSARFIII